MKVKNEDNITHINGHTVKSPKKVNTRKDIQFMRRLFHCSMGVFTATVYNLFLTHQQAVYILGFCACTLYILEQIRVNYPHLMNKLGFITNHIMRAEEQLKESSAVPYAITILLCMITFPKIISLVAIYTLAISDPLSAIFGIRFGKHHIVKDKSIEGSAAFFISQFTITFLVFYYYVDLPLSGMFSVAFLLSLLTSAFEMIPLKIDDNLTIPLFTGIMLWIIVFIASIPVH